MADKRLNILEGIEKGISPSYLGGFNKITEIDLESVPGAVIPEFRLRTEYPYDVTMAATTFTAATSDLCTAGTTILGSWQDGQSVLLTTTDTLPAGLAINTIYYVMITGSTTFKLADTLAHLKAGTAVDITDTGTGTHTITPIVMEAPVTILKNGSDRYALDYHNGAIWLNSSGYGDTWVKIKGKTGVFYNIAIWKNYLLAFGPANQVEVWGGLDDLDTADWKTWDGADGGIYVPLFAHGGGRFPNVVMSNQTLYIGDDYDIASLSETAGDTFDPTDHTSYTWNNSALDLPKNEVASCLAEYNYQLAIGTGRGSNYDAKIYFWDTVSPSYDNVLYAENSWIYNMLSFGGILYFVCSDQTHRTDGVIYATNGSTIKKAFRIPRPSTGTQQIKTSYPYTIEKRSMVEWNNGILVGVGGKYGAGIYWINTDIGAVTQRFIEASGNEGSATDTINFYAILPEENNLTVGVYPELAASQVYKIETLNNTTASVPYRINTNSYFETGLITVGTKYQPTTYRFFEIQLGKELASGEAVILYYRVNLTDSYTSIGSVSYTNDGAVHSKIIENSSVSGDQIQFKCIITCGNTATTGPEIKAIYIY